MSQLSYAEYGANEDYFFGAEGGGRPNVYALVIYDIVDNKKRTRFAKFMSGFGRRVQKSCFETTVSLTAFNKMLDGITEFCDDEDSIRVYRLSGASQVYSWGKDEQEEDEDVIVL